MNNKTRIISYQITVPITFSFTGTTDESIDEMLDRAEAALPNILERGRYSYKNYEMHVTHQYIHYTQEEFAEDLAKWRGEKNE